mmetsp:Transcript_60217/g.141819  ORF Transcript_60217/g.141819 Transcript_60217/m.141819 type:complete len:366 (-) Transcript_60217:213-1310(-)
MAKFEEADPRWKVKELGQQGTNVNNWHWTENDAFPLFKDMFTEKLDGKMLLQGVADAVPGLVADLNCWKLDKITGEASVAKRKGKKVIVIYELEVTVKWESTLKNVAGETISTSKGSYIMPCIDTVEEIDGFEIQVKCNKDGKEQDAANAFAKKQGQAALKAAIVAIIREIQEAAAASGAQGGGAALPSADKALSEQSDSLARAQEKEKEKDKKNSGGSSSGAKGKITLDVKFNCPPKEIFECFTVPQKAMAFTQSKVVLGTTAGEPMSLFDGSIVGKVVECEDEKRIVWDWRQSSWPEDCVSKAVLTFAEQNEGVTKVSLSHTGIPYNDGRGNDDQPRVVEEGWKRNIFDRIKMVFGYGVPQFS